MHRKAVTAPLFIVLITAVLSACFGATGNEESFDNQVQAGVAATLTKEAFIQSIDSARETEQVLNMPTATEAATSTPSPSQTITLTPTLNPIHRLIPGSPSTVHMYISDIVTVDLAKEKTALGDYFSWNRLERPYTPKTMIYKDYLDIYQAGLVSSNKWIYITITLIGKLPEDGDISYAVELDTDHDGRGDFLIVTDLPAEKTWSTAGVSIFADQDDDIGGIFPAYEEVANPPSTGYEAVIFSDGIGQDQDLAWSRRDPDYKNQLQIAFKENLVGDLGFLWSIWADEGIRDPALFDINDHFTFDEAGSPNKGNYRYPLKAVALVDSTCKAWYGYVPSGFEPGLCFTEGQVVKNRPGYGWCEPDPIYSGCGNNPCLSTCPAKRFCIPCSLP